MMMMMFAYNPVLVDHVLNLLAVWFSFFFKFVVLSFYGREFNGYDLGRGQIRYVILSQLRTKFEIDSVNK